MVETANNFLASFHAFTSDEVLAGSLRDGFEALSGGSFGFFGCPADTAIP